MGAWGPLFGGPVGWPGTLLLITLVAAPLIVKDHLEAFTSSLLAQMALLGAAVSYAFSAVFGRRFRTLGIPPMQIATGQVTAAALLLLPLVVLIDRPWSLPRPACPHCWLFWDWR